MSYNNNWFYWLRTPQTSSIPDIIDSSYVRNVSNDGSVFSYFSSFGGYGGIRPALYLQVKGLTFESGNGEEGSPYILSIQKY
ncbi:hypothetical protein Amet_1825 [Alkaliphilus metalliredigens QYMF]|uniref:DUF6273 domain-containing protein n=1 Tax=Alkaliphilus metalliredigens (strain QYMF) TaxID=293826 RepID=A6TP77_ALKMQ|nr:hypothetical protein Amet_1825 [Alkaliphilus metalliredigens QYMF]